MLIYTGWC